MSTKDVMQFKHGDFMWFLDDNGCLLVGKIFTSGRNKHNILSLALDVGFNSNNEIERIFRDIEWLKKHNAELASSDLEIVARHNYLSWIKREK